MNTTVADSAWKDWADSIIAREMIARIVREHLLRKSVTYVDWFIIGTLCVASSKEIN